MAEGFVTKDECYKINEEIKSDISQIKTALVGEDLRSGIVKDVTEIKTTLKNSRSHNQGNNSSEGFGRRERAIVYSSAIASSGLVIAEVLKFIVTRSV